MSDAQGASNVRCRCCEALTLPELAAYPEWSTGEGAELKARGVTLAGRVLFTLEELSKFKGGPEAVVDFKLNMLRRGLLERIHELYQIGV